MAAAPDLWIFFLLVFGVVLLPGMDMAYVASSALTAGLRGGFAAVLGIVAGGVVHVAVGATGIATLLLLWPAAFDALLVAGALYMIWIGWGIFHASSDAPAPTVRAPSHLRTIVGRATTTALLNPKAYAFMLAVFPAFVHSPNRTLMAQALCLGAIVAATQALVYGVVAASSASAGRWTGPTARARHAIAKVVGVTLMIVAVVTPLLSWHPMHAPVFAGGPRLLAALAPSFETDGR